MKSCCYYDSVQAVYSLLYKLCGEYILLWPHDCPVPKHDSLHIVNNLIGWSYMECIMLIYMSYSNYVFRFFGNISQVIERFI